MQLTGNLTFSCCFLLSLCVAATSCKHSGSDVSGVRDDSSVGKSGQIATLDQASLLATNPGVEAATTASLIAAIKQSVAGSRDAHPKAHGCFDDVALTVDSDIPAAMQNELFKPGLRYKAAVRLSHGSGNPKASDLIPDVHGFALKIFLENRFEPAPPIAANLPLVNPQTGEVVGQVEVEELRLGLEHEVGEKYYHSVDIIAINGIHEFMVNGLADYRDFFAAGGVLKEVIPYLLQNQGELPTELSNPALTPALAAITPAIQQGSLYQTFSGGELAKERVPELVFEVKNAVFAVLFNRTRGGESGAIAELVRSGNGHQTWDALASTYQSFVPYRFGGAESASEGPAVKYQIQAIDCQTKAVVDHDNANPPAYVLAHLRGENAPNFLSSVLAEQVRNQDHCFALKAQPWQTRFPSLDAAAAVWGDRTYVQIAELKINRNATFMDPDKCEKLSFNPGHGPASFQGAGETQRARKLIYAAIETLRNQQQLEN